MLIAQSLSTLPFARWAHAQFLMFFFRSKLLPQLVRRPVPRLPHVKHCPHWTQAPSSPGRSGVNRGVVFRQVYFTWLCVETVLVDLCVI